MAKRWLAVSTIIPLLILGSGIQLTRYGVGHLNCMFKNEGLSGHISFSRNGNIKGSCLINRTSVHNCTTKYDYIKMFGKVYLGVSVSVDIKGVCEPDDYQCQFNSQLANLKVTSKDTANCSNAVKIKPEHIVIVMSSILATLISALLKM